MKKRNTQAMVPVVLTAEELGKLLSPSRGRQRLVLMVGIPGSGKSTVGDGIVEQGGYVRLSYDAIRLALYGDASEHGGEGEVGKKFREELRAALTAGKSVLVDNTNFLTDMRTHIIDIARQCGVTDVHLVVMKIPLPLCLERNRARDRVVPTRQVRQMNWLLTTQNWPTGKEGRMTIVRPGPQPYTYSVGGFAAVYAGGKPANSQPRKENVMKTNDQRGYVAFGDAARKIGIQSQYASRYVRGDGDHANCGSDPALGRELRFIGDACDYHDLLIHQDDLDEFVRRVRAAKQKEGGLFAFLNREKEGSNGE